MNNLTWTAGPQLQSDDDHEKRRKLEIIKKACNIDLVVEGIVEKMDFLGLKAARSVNQLWKKEAMQQLSTRNCAQINIILDGRSNDGGGSEDYKKLTALSELLDKSTKWLCDSFNFTCYGDWSSSIDFFKIHGHKMKTLRLNLEGGFGFPETLLHVPNLVALHIEKYSYWSSWKSREEFKFPNLKFISHNTYVDCPVEQIPFEVLNAATNLKCLKSFVDSNIDFKNVSNAGKVQAIKRLWLRDTSGLETLNALVNRGLKLDEISFELCCTEVVRQNRNSVNSLQNILNASSATLKLMKLDTCCGLTQEIRFPTFDKLHTIAVKHWTPNVSNTQIFPRSINLQDTFPHLTTLDLSNIASMSPETSARNWESIFPSSSNSRGNLKSVTTLILDFWVDEFWMRELHILCPNFDTLVLHLDYYPHVRFCPAFPNVIHLWSHLKRIQVNAQWHLLIDWDSVFTGFSKESLKLFENVGDPVWTELEKGRCQPSIIDMKELETLKIWIMDCDTAKELKLTQVSGLAFQQLPKLKVSIYYRHSDKDAHHAKLALESIAPFVQVEDEYFLTPKYYNGI